MAIHGHGLSNGAQIVYRSTGGALGGLTQDTTYWVRVIDAIGAPFDSREGDLEAAVPRESRPWRVTATRTREEYPAWDPDGSRIAYAS